MTMYKSLTERSMRTQLTRFLSKSSPAPAKAREPTVSIHQSITPDYLICLEDGKKFKSLIVHLAAIGLTPDQYRAKWNLPRDYPMLAPNYAAQRSTLGRQMGLGQARAKTARAKRTGSPNVAVASCGAFRLAALLSFGAGPRARKMPPEETA
jgi:predicted transcriptional regulator